jgi:hypothetical protein
LILADQWASVVGSDRFSDCAFLAGADRKVIPAHRTMLAVASPVFARLFFGSGSSGSGGGGGSEAQTKPGADSKESKESKEGKEPGRPPGLRLVPSASGSGRVEVEAPDVRPEILKTLLRAVYTDTVRCLPF